MENKSWFKKTFTGRQGRKLREYLTAYAFIAPASILIFVFGIFPVAFALYVSLHKWRIKRTDFIHLKNYVDAIGNLAYVVVFILGLLALAGVYYLIKKSIETASENDDRPWICILPGVAYAFTIFAFFNWFYRALPEVLDIATKLRGVKRTQNLFIQLLGEALRSEQVLPAWRIFFWSMVASIALGVIVRRLWRSKRNASYQTNFALTVAALVTGVGLLYYTFQQVKNAYTIAFEKGVDPGIWPQFITIVGGMILLALAWLLWSRADKVRSNGKFFVYIFAAIFLMVGGWLLIGEIPTIVASGDKDLWHGLKVTVFFSLGTVPFQLIIALFLSVLLFQKVPGSDFFRIVYFIPYVTPGIASAAVFQQMFSNRQSAPVNMLLRTLGLPAQQWLYEPKGFMTLLGEFFGWSIPKWAAGPSLALCVIMLHSIWTYVGYYVVIYLAGLGNIPKELNDQAEVDGANGWQVFRHITFPLLSPTTYFLSLIGIIGTFKAFNTIWVLRSNMALKTTDTFSVTIFIEFFEKLRYGYASALSFVLFGIILILTLINNRTQGKKVFYG
ncbi:MAG: ABC transporter permease subunit [Brevefilum sp.]|jgi:ABC-type sugar transport system permease subunit